MALRRSSGETREEPVGSEAGMASQPSESSREPGAASPQRLRPWTPTLRIDAARQREAREAHDPREP